MKTQTSLVAKQVRLQNWSVMINDCQSRPSDMSVDDWCRQNNITKANYYYRLRKVREALLEQVDHIQFIELPVPKNVDSSSATSDQQKSLSNPVAILRGPHDISVEIFSGATPELIGTIIRGFHYAQ
jgi:hypothetical protein